MINKLNFSTSDYHRKLQTSVLLLLLSCLAFVFIPYIVADANAETASARLDWSKITLELDTGSNSGNVAFNGGDAIIPDEPGKVSAEQKTLTVNTTGKHFNVYLSMDSSVGRNNKLCYDFDANDTEKNTCTHTGMGVNPVAEDSGAPASLTGNDWGYALNDGESGFSSAGTYANANLSGDIISSTTTNAADLALYNAKFAAVPIFGEESLIWSADTNNPNGFGTNIIDGETRTGDQNNTKTVVYGIKINNNLVAGTYGSKILYTAVASASDLNTPSTNIVSSLTLGGPTDLATLYMDIDAENAEIKERNISVRLVKHSDAATADSNNDGKFTEAELTSAINSSVGSCLIASHSLTLSTGSLNVGCVLPDLGLNEGTDYDFIVEIPITGGLTRKYISYKTEGGNIGAIRYVGLQTKKNATEYYVDTMQGITAGVCAMTNVWGATVGSDARIYNRTGTGVALANTAEDSNALGLGTFALEDIRDNKEYLVRRLADGNCWMVQNLALELGDFAGKDDTNGGLTPANTDLADSGRDYWDPSESTVTKYNTTYADALTTAGLSKDFTGLATYLLGTSVAQEQFQTYEKTGWNYSWGSRKNESGDIIISTDSGNTSPANRSSNNNSASHRGDGVWLESNSRSEIPRSYSNHDTSLGKGYRYLPINTEDGTAGSYSDNTSVTSTFASTTTDTTNGGYYGNEYIGNYYNWYSATAESGKFEQTSVADKTNDDSICPSGWQLPTDGNLSQDRSWAKLLKNTTAGYGLFVQDGTQSSDTNPYSSSTEPSLRLHQVPLSVIPSGLYGWIYGNLYGRGFYGGYWISAPTNDKSRARFLNFTDTSVKPQSTDFKDLGFTIRCVARDTETTTVEEEEEEAVACEAGKICYDGNGGTGTMSDQTASASSDVMLTAPTYNKLGYAFVGWNTQENGFGTTYQANETITTPSTLSSEGLQLYAKWLPSAGEMQNWSGCSTLGEHQTVALTDTRDNKTYAVRKLKDGNCWMVNNLNLELANFAGTNNLTSDNTDLSTSRTDLTDIGNGKKAWDPSASTVAKYQSGETFSDFTLRVLGQSQPAQFQSANQTGYHWGSKYNENGEIVGTTSSCSNKSTNINSRAVVYANRLGYCVENNSRSEIPRSQNVDNDGLYNWYAATAESGTFSMNNSVTSDSICPAGWQLPVQSNDIDGSRIDKSYRKLFKETTSGYDLSISEGDSDTNATAIDFVHKSPISLSLARRYNWYDGSNIQQNSNGFWIAHSYNYYLASDTYYDTVSKAFYSQASDNKIHGHAVRCVNRD